MNVFSLCQSPIGTEAIYIIGVTLIIALTFTFVLRKWYKMKIKKSIKIIAEFCFRQKLQKVKDVTTFGIIEASFAGYHRFVNAVSCKIVTIFAI